MRFRYFDPLQQSTVAGDLDGAAAVSELVTTVKALRAQCPPAVEFAGPDGTSLVLGVAADRAVILWTDSAGTTSHSVGDSTGAGLVFDYFGAYTEVPATYSLPLEDAVAAVGGYVSDGGSPAVRMLID